MIIDHAMIKDLSLNMFDTSREISIDTHKGYQIYCLIATIIHLSDFLIK